MHSKRAEYIIADCIEELQVKIIVHGVLSFIMWIFKIIIIHIIKKNIKIILNK